MNKQSIILDSSVIAKWFFHDEEDNEKALLIKDQFARKKISIAAPLVIFYENNNLLKTAVKAFRIDEKLGLNAYKAFLQLDFILYSSEELLLKALEIALKYNISSYDASYLALAEYLQVKFLTANKKLLNKASGKFIGDLKDYG